MTVADSLRRLKRMIAADGWLVATLQPSGGGSGGGDDDEQKNRKMAEWPWASNPATLDPFSVETVEIARSRGANNSSAAVLLARVTEDA